MCVSFFMGLVNLPGICTTIMYKTVSAKATKGNLHHSTIKFTVI